MLLLILSLLQSALDHPSPGARWAGDWQIDRRASRFRGDMIRIERTTTGYRFIIGPVRYVVPDDGAFHATIEGRELRLLKLGDRRWQREHRVNGRIVDKSVLAVSSDRATLTILGEHNGVGAETMVREGAGTGLAGQWRSTRLGANVAPTLSIGALANGRLRWGSIAEGNYYVATIGGPPAVNQGPTATPVATFQLATSGDGTLHWTERLKGRPYRLGVDRLSANGTTLTEAVWPAGEPQERQTLVYHQHR